MKQFLLVAILFLSSLSAIHAQQTDSITIPKEKESIIQVVENWYSNHMNYWSITVLMTIESSFIPFPSEIVIPPAVYVAGRTESTLNVSDSYFVNVLLIILFGTIGALLGAIINYLLAMWLGRPIIYKIADSKLGKMLLLSSEKIQRSEVYFNQHGKVSTFVGRLIPGIRQLISIPAGLAKMNFFTFIGFTALGAGIWNIILALLGYIAHGQTELISKYSHELSYVVLAIVVLALLYVVAKKFIKRKQ